MCIFGSGQGNAPKNPPKVAPSPTTGSVTAATPQTGVVDPAVEQSKKTLTALQQNRSLLVRRQGAFGNIRTSPMGDSTFGSASGGTGYATFGGTKKAA
jgi:hypothetical protein